MLVTACTPWSKPELTNIPVSSPTINEIESSTALPGDLIPPVSPEEEKKTFTFEDDELGVKLQYPGSCYFNKGIFQCTNFTMSIWLLEGEQVAAITNPEITFKDGETELKYSFAKDDKTYQLLAWYKGQDNIEIDATIDKIAKTFVFTR